MMLNKNFICRVCGYHTPHFAPWGDDGKIPSYGICACCGVEFGYEDYTLDSLKEYRSQWIKNGAKWFKPKLQPNNWILENQLANIPPEFI